MLSEHPLIASVSGKVYDQKVYIEQRKELENGRAGAIFIVLIIGGFFAVFWLPAFLYLFIVKPKKIK
jgi:hypothetical protein